MVTSLGQQQFSFPTAVLGKMPAEKTEGHHSMIIHMCDLLGVRLLYHVNLLLGLS